MEESATRRGVSSMAMNVAGTQNGLVPGMETNDKLHSQYNAAMEMKEMKMALSETQSSVKGEKKAMSEMQGAVDSYQRKSRKTMKQQNHSSKSIVEESSTSEMAAREQRQLTSSKQMASKQHIQTTQEQQKQYSSE